MLRRDEGASGPAITEAMGWARRTSAVALAGLVKKGITGEVLVLERVRQVGSTPMRARPGSRCWSRSVKVCGVISACSQPPSRAA
jgi:hypothetical protein